MRDDQKTGRRCDRFTAFGIKLPSLAAGRALRTRNIPPDVYDRWMRPMARRKHQKPDNTQVAGGCRAGNSKTEFRKGRS